MLAVVVIVVALMHFNLAALSEPGRLETRIADLSKGVPHSSREPPGNSPPPAAHKSQHCCRRLALRLDCSVCHSDDGRGQTPAGEWMYPRAADLTSKRVQTYSDPELFWIIQNGIRFSGMPAFGKVGTW